MTAFSSIAHSPVVFKGDINAIGKLEIIIDDFAVKWQLSDNVKFTLNLILEELISNVFFYGKPVHDEEITIQLFLEKKKQEVWIKLIDNTMKFNPLTKETKVGNKPLEELKIGGLGIHLVKKMTKSMVYERKNEHNHLILSITI
jgi:anti-sigma regulatory factor (Ser/Thr protein kinase)